jgi:hypothetical protein
VAMAAATTLVSTGTAGVAIGEPQRASGPDHRTEARKTALEAGLQVAPKHTSRPTTTVNGKTVAAPNPYLALVADPSTVDWSYWRTWLDRKSAQRAKAEAAAEASGSRVGSTIAVPTPMSYDEQEPAGELGFNDAQANAEPIARFGIGRRFRAVKILGSVTSVTISTPTITTAEDQGSIPLATDSGIHAARDGFAITSTIGDGPHGSSAADPAERTGDFDFFELEATAGEVINANTAQNPTPVLDTVVALYDSTGEVLAVDDDGGPGLTSLLSYEITTSGTYYVMVAGYRLGGPLPVDPFDSGSGSGIGREGTYRLAVTAGPVDRDYYGVRLRPGDVLGGTLDGGAPMVAVHRVDGRQMVGSQQDASFIYPLESPLPGGGSTFGYVAEEPGWYAVSVRNGTGAYQLLLEVYRPGTELKPAGTVQKVFLDFDGARLNTAIFGGSGVVTLSPMRSFLGRWGLTNADEDAVIDAVVAEVRENIKRDLEKRGLNDHTQVRVLNSRDDNDPFGRANVSRVIVGGTRGQAGVNTIGIAQTIDPGNYAVQETALVLLDILSDPDPSEDASLNAYITPASDKVAFLGQALGNVVSHETGHYVGSFHVDQFDGVDNLMDQGGNFPALFAVGPDGVGGTADDTDVDFGEDVYNPNEGFTGLEDTLNHSAFGLSLG